MQRHLGIVGLAAAIVAGAISGCGNNNTAPERLLKEQEDVLAGILVVTGGMATATEGAQAGATNGDDKTPSQTAAKQTVLGDCPEITLEAADGDEPASITIDFGDGCQPGGDPEWICSGTLTGTLSLIPREITLTFATLACGSATEAGDLTTVDGSCAYQWSRAGGVVSLTGDTDMTVTDATGSVTYDAAGTAIYETDPNATTVETYEGALTIDDDTWTLVLEATRVSYELYENFVPDSGLATATGLQAGSLAVRFDEDSPVTGWVTISINGGPFFPWQLAGF